MVVEPAAGLRRCLEVTHLAAVDWCLPATAPQCDRSHGRRDDDQNDEPAHFDLPG